MVSGGDHFDFFCPQDQLQLGICRIFLLLALPLLWLGIFQMISLQFNTYINVLCVVGHFPTLGCNWQGKHTILDKSCQQHTNPAASGRFVGARRAFTFGGSCLYFEIMQPAGQRTALCFRQPCWLVVSGGGGYLTKLDSVWRGRWLPWQAILIHFRQLMLKRCSS